MKLISIEIDGQKRVAALTGPESCVVLDPADGWPVELKQILESVDLSRRLSDGIEGPTTIFSETQLLAPITQVGKLICIGKNYADHAREMGGEPPEIPVVFSKFPSAIAAPNSGIPLPPISNQVDYEAELVVVIGKSGKQISRENALDHVFGYCCGNDISARDWQKGKPGGQWLLGKTFDSFAPIGPSIVTKDEIQDPHDLDIQLRLNGQIMQESNTRHLIFPIDHLISHLSQFFTFEPGDLIFTGTPSGVGAGRIPPQFLNPGDQLEVEIEGLGVLKNQMVGSAIC